MTRHSVHESEPATVCHDCGIRGQVGERWLNSDTCDACAYRASVIKWRPELPVPPHGKGPNYRNEVPA